MSLLSFSNISRSYGLQQVLDGVSFGINRGDHIGLIGRNGAGKSTVLRLITGRERPDSGTIHRLPRIRIGQVEQDPTLDPDLTVAEAVLLGRPDLVKMEADLRALEARFADPAEDHESVMQQYGDLQHEYDRLGGHAFHGKASAVLGGLGLPVETHERPVGVLSGGQRTRLALAQLLLSDPDILLLDEPTNHLDLEATEWLQAYLQRSCATMVIVSHDRYLLDAVCDNIIELERCRSSVYTGNYTAFLKQKEERQERERELYSRQQEEIQKLESYIRRYKAGNRATMAKSREKMLARIEVMDRPRDSKELRLKLGDVSRSGKDVIRLNELGMAFGELRLFNHLNMVVERGDRVGLVGPNGAGKTTLIKLIMGTLTPTEGTVQVGSNVRVAYFSQDLKTAGGNRTIVDEILADSELDLGAARSLLARFLFTDEEVFKSVEDLSGGERNRVALCKLFLSRPNLLILDEPTNHLDIATREGLIAALQEFQGTLLVASHDRYLLDRIVTRVVEVADGRATDHRGNYTDFRRARSGEPEPASPRQPSPGDNRPAAKGQVRLGAPGPGKARAPVSPTGKAGAQTSSQKGRSGPGGPSRPASGQRLEKQIQEMEARFKVLTGRMNDPELYKSPDMLTVVEEYDRVRSRLDRLYEEWEQAAG